MSRFQFRAEGHRLTRTTFSLIRALSKLGYCSRTDAVKLVEAGLITVNGIVANSPTQRVDIQRAKIAVNNTEVVASEKIYYMLNKPRGLLTTRRDPRQRGTVYDQLPKNLPFISPVGRLDKASEGLLLLTNDSVWAAHILNPASRIEKTYHVKIDCEADGDFASRLLGPIENGGEILMAVSAQVLRTSARSSWLEVVLVEGRNRQVRRMMASQGANVLRLVRTAVGGISLGSLPKGDARLLTGAERSMLDSRLKR